MSHGHTMTVANGGQVLGQHAGPASHVPEGAHEMPSGNWVRLADPRKLTRGDKRDLIAGVADKTTVAEIGFAVADLMLTWLVVEWSYPLPLPSADPGVLYQIPGVDDEAISELIRPAKELLFPAAATPDTAGDERSPTAPSGE